MLIFQGTGSWTLSRLPRLRAPSKPWWARASKPKWPKWVSLRRNVGRPLLYVACSGSQRLNRLSINISLLFNFLSSLSHHHLLLSLTLFSHLYIFLSSFHYLYFHSTKNCLFGVYVQCLDCLKIGLVYLVYLYTIYYFFKLS